MTETETSLSALSAHDWNVVRNRWACGQDHYVHKVGGRWSIDAVAPGFPRYRTKTEATKIADDLICAESHWRLARGG